MRTLHKRTARKIVAAAAALTLAGVGLIAAPPPQAKAYMPGCETAPWPDLFNWARKRTICDGPRDSDGSWLRVREIWTPGGYVPIITTCGSYSCTTTGGYWRPTVTHSIVEYRLTDDTVPPQEPGWLPEGTARVL